MLEETKPVFKMYIKDGCPYCVKARDYILNDLKASLHTIDVTNEPILRKMIIEETGQKTVPAIFIGDEFIGGCDDLLKNKSSGLLEMKVLREELKALRLQLAALKEEVKALL